MNTFFLLTQGSPSGKKSAPHHQDRRNAQDAELRASSTHARGGKPSPPPNTHRHSISIRILLERASRMKKEREERRPEGCLESIQDRGRRLQEGLVLRNVGQAGMPFRTPPGVL